MTEQTPNESLPPLGATAPMMSTPPPPPPPRPPMAAKASAANATDATPTPKSSGQRPRRSMVFAAFAVLAVGGVAAGVLVGTGNGDSSDTSGDAVAAAPPMHLVETTRRRR